MCVVLKKNYFSAFKNLKQNSFVYGMNVSPCLLCVCFVCTVAVHVQRVGGHVWSAVSGCVHVNTVVHREWLETVGSCPTALYAHHWSE